MWQAPITRVLLIVAFVCCNQTCFGHGEESRKVNVRLRVSAIVNVIPHSKPLVTINQAYLSLFSLELFLCQKYPKQVEAPAGNWLDFFISSAYANHGVAFTEPTQLSAQRKINLLQTTDLNIGVLDIPYGNYCAINVTFAHHQQSDYSFYLSGVRSSLDAASPGTASSITEGPFEVRGTYGFGENVAVEFTIPQTATASNDTPLSLELSIAPQTIFSGLKLEESEHQIVRHVVLGLSNQLSVTLVP